MDDLVLGLICVAISSILYGSYFVPIKAFETRDGFFVYWIQTIPIFAEGFVVAWVFNFPAFSWYGAAGGFLFGTGNMLAVPIVNSIGMGIGVLLWTSVQIVVGWALPRFGLFGLKAEVPKSVVMEAFGIVITMISGFMFAGVRSTGGQRRASNVASNVKNEVATISDTENETGTEIPAAGVHERSKLQYFLAKFDKRKMLAVVMAIVSGTFYGLQMSPVTYSETRVANASTNGLDYVFSFNTGASLTCSFWFLIYCVIKRNKPFLNQQLVIPSIIYGLMWTLATTAWFVSIDKLSQAVSYPLTARLPGVVAALWSVFYYKEVKGKRDLILMLCAVLTAFLGVTLIGIAKEG